MWIGSGLHCWIIIQWSRLIKTLTFFVTKFWFFKIMIFLGLWFFKILIFQDFDFSILWLWRFLTRLGSRKLVFDDKITFRLRLSKSEKQNTVQIIAIKKHLVFYPEQWNNNLWKLKICPTYSLIYIYKYISSFILYIPARNFNSKLFSQQSLNFTINIIMKSFLLSFPHESYPISSHIFTFPTIK